MIQNMTGAGTSEDVKVKKIEKAMYSEGKLNNLSVTTDTGIQRDKIKGLYIQQYDYLKLYYCVWSKITNILETGKIYDDSSMVQRNYGSTLTIDEEGKVTLETANAGSISGGAFLNYTIFVFYTE